MRPGKQARGGTFAGALGGPRRRRAVVHKLAASISAATTQFVLDAFPPGREGQTNPSLATLSVPVAFRRLTVFSENAF